MQIRKKFEEEIAIDSIYSFKTTRINPAQYDCLRNRLISLTGIELGDNKQTLIETRLSKRLSVLKLDSFTQYINYLEKDPNEISNFVNSLTTNKTDWFREATHFSYLTKQVLPSIEILPRSNSADQTLYLWSAASSSGEEAYSLAITMREYLKDSKQDFRIFGTDIDSEILSKAINARYNEENIRQQVPPEYRNKYFSKLANQTKNCIQVSSELSSRTKFRQYNLVEGKLPTEIKFDVIFLRNVLIYFSRTTIETVINGMIKNLRPGGYLFIGHSESLSGLSIPLIHVSESVYRLVP